MSRMRLSKRSERMEFAYSNNLRHHDRNYIGTDEEWLDFDPKESYWELLKYFHSHAIDMDKPRPCPFCGGVPIFEYWNEIASFVKCECGSEMYGKNKSSAINKWNTRHADGLKDRSTQREYWQGKE